MTFDALRRADELLELLAWLEGEGLGDFGRAPLGRLLGCSDEELGAASDALLRRGLVQLDAGALRLTPAGRDAASARASGERPRHAGHAPHGLCPPDCDCQEEVHACERPR